MADDHYGVPFHFAEKDEVLQWLCGLLSDIHACVRFPGHEDRCVHYGCFCRGDDPTHTWLDENGIEHKWGGADTMYLDWLTIVVGKAISEHQATWEDE